MQCKLSEQQIQTVLREAARVRRSPFDPEIARQGELRLRMEQGDMNDLANLMAISKLLGQTEADNSE